MNYTYKPIIIYLKCTLIKQCIKQSRIRRGKWTNDVLTYLKRISDQTEQYCGVELCHNASVQYMRLTSWITQEGSTCSDRCKSREIQGNRVTLKQQREQVVMLLWLSNAMYHLPNIILHNIVLFWHTVD